MLAVEARAASQGCTKNITFTDVSNGSEMVTVPRAARNLAETCLNTLFCKHSLIFLLNQETDCLSHGRIKKRSNSSYWCDCNHLNVECC